MLMYDTEYWFLNFYKNDIYSTYTPIPKDKVERIFKIVDKINQPNKYEMYECEYQDKLFIFLTNLKRS